MVNVVKKPGPNSKYLEAVSAQVEFAHVLVAPAVRAGVAVEVAHEVGVGVLVGGEVEARLAQQQLAADLAVGHDVAARARILQHLLPTSKRQKDMDFIFYLFILLFGFWFSGANKGSALFVS